MSSEHEETPTGAVQGIESRSEIRFGRQGDGARVQYKHFSIPAIYTNRAGQSRSGAQCGDLRSARGRVAKPGDVKA